jgi:hypothetical protein
MYCTHGQYSNVPGTTMDQQKRDNSIPRPRRAFAFVPYIRMVHVLQLAYSTVNWFCFTYVCLSVPDFSELLKFENSGPLTHLDFLLLYVDLLTHHLYVLGYSTYYRYVTVNCSLINVG